MHATSLLDMPVCSISRCINMCHVSHSHIREDGGPDGTLNAAFPVVSFSRLVHPSLVRHLAPSQPPQFTQESEHFQEFEPQPPRRARIHPDVRPHISNTNHSCRAVTPGRKKQSTKIKQVGLKWWRITYRCHFRSLLKVFAASRFERRNEIGKSTTRSSPLA